MQPFKTAQDITTYGRRIFRFSDASKHLARGLTKANMPPEQIRLILGAGKYNTLEEKDEGYIIYGPEKTAAAKSNRSGLFGIFPIIHEPYRKLSLEAPILLGKAGCKLQLCHDGTFYRVPLDRAPLTFTPMQRQHNKAGQIVLLRDTTLTSDQGHTITLPANTPLTAANNKMFTSPRDQRLKWAAGPQDETICIVDSAGQRLDDGAAIIMLWGSMGARGFKRHGRSTAEYDTIARDGTDDDVTAEHYMLQWMESLKRINGIDMMPVFNRYAAEAVETIRNDSGLMQALALTSHAATTLAALPQLPERRTMQKHATMAAYGPLQYELAYLSEAPASLQALLDQLGIVATPASNHVPAEMLQSFDAALAHACENLKQQYVAMRHIEQIAYQAELIKHTMSHEEFELSPAWADGTASWLKSGAVLNELLADTSPHDLQALTASISTQLSDRGMKALGNRVQMLKQTAHGKIPWSGKELGYANELRRILRDIQQEVEATRTPDNHDISGLVRELRENMTLLQEGIERMQGGSERRPVRRTWRRLIPNIEKLIEFMERFDSDLGKTYQAYGNIRCIEDHIAAQLSEPPGTTQLREPMLQGLTIENGAQLSV